MDSVFFTRRDMSEQYKITNKLVSSRLWVSPTKDFLPALMKKMCDQYDKNEHSKKFIPVKVMLHVN